jgi:anthranilate 1,2-dioxygenase small subunit
MAAPDRERLLLRLEIDEFNAAYAAALDRRELRRWPGFFAENPVYRITARENYDAGLPIGLVYCDSTGMLEDRVEAILNTTVFAPRAIVHLITNIAIDSVAVDGAIAANANFLLIENHLDRNPQLLMAGQYVDRFVRRDGALRLQERHCLYDTAVIQTSLIYPV